MALKESEKARLFSPKSGQKRPLSRPPRAYSVEPFPGPERLSFKIFTGGFFSNQTNFTQPFKAKPMTNPFIDLTTTRGKSMQINVNHIVGFQDQTFSNSEARCTYIILNNTGVTTVHVKENYDEVSTMIAKAFNQPKETK